MKVYYPHVIDFWGHISQCCETQALPLKHYRICIIFSSQDPRASLVKRERSSGSQSFLHITFITTGLISGHIPSVTGHSGSTIHNIYSARISVPNLVVPSTPEEVAAGMPAWKWRTPLKSTADYWEGTCHIPALGFEYSLLHRLVQRAFESLPCSTDCSSADTCRDRPLRPGAHGMSQHVGSPDV